MIPRPGLQQSVGVQSEFEFNFESLGKKFEKSFSCFLGFGKLSFFGQELGYSHMGRKRSGLGTTGRCSLVLLVMGFVLLTAVSIFMPYVLGPQSPPASSSSLSANSKMEFLRYAGGNFDGENLELEGGGCCKGIRNLELWGAAVKWAKDFKLNSSEECCKACKAMCRRKDGPCLCDTWVFCGNKVACGDKFGECWLKKQEDVLAPDSQETGNKTMWTSGIIFGREEGIIGLETEYGTLRIKLFPDCSPHSVAYILDLLALRHSGGCHFYRAEGRGHSWDTKGNHMKDASFGPPFALIQGTLETQALTFKKIRSEHCPTVRRGSVAWIGSGPEFFISLANHKEWKKAYTMFGSVLQEDMVIAEKIAKLPTKSDVWNDINVSILENTVPLKIRRIESGRGDLALSVEY